MTRPQLTTRRAALRLGYTCDNACVFCAQAGVELDPPALADPREVLVELRKDHDELSFVGGEPALDPRLPELIASARALGFSAIGVQTNGRRLAGDEALFRALVAAGLNDLHLSIHAPTAEAHDYHTGQAGSFVAILELLGWAQRAGLTIVATTVITRSNLRELPKLPPVLKRRGVAGWLLEPVRPFGRAADNFARVVPRFGMAMPWACHGLEQARRHDLSAWIRGAPLCALGPFAASVIGDAPRSYVDHGVETPAGATGPCTACPARPRCPGIDPVYLEVFGTKEFSPRPARPAASFDEGRARLMRMFVGVGLRLERPPQLYSPPAEPAEPAEPAGPSKLRRLPVLSNAPANQAKSNSDS